MKILRIVSLILFCALPSFAQRVIDFADVPAIISGRDNLAGYWKMGEASGNFADSGPNGCTTVASNMTYGATGGLIGVTDKAATFNGTNSSVIASGCSQALFVTNTTSKFSSFGWVNHNLAACGSDGPKFVVWGKFTDVAASVGWAVILRCQDANSPTLPDFCIQLQNTSSNRLLKCADGALAPNVWYQIGFSYDGSSTIAGITLYVNGVAANDNASQRVSTLGASSITTTTSPAIGTTTLSFGLYTGSLQGIVIRNGQTTPQEMERLFFRGIISPTQVIRNVVEDTDMGTDLDDLRSMSVVNLLAKTGYENVLGAVTTISIDAAPECTVMSLQKGGLGGRVLGAYQANNSRTVATSAYCTTSGNVISTLTTATVTRAGFDACGIAYRKLFANATNASITVYMQGFGQCMRDFMQSAGDGISASTGLQLLAAKASRVIWVAGTWPGPTVGDNNLCFGGANSDPCDAAQYIFANWPAAVKLILIGVNLWDSVSNGTQARMQAILPANNPSLIGSNAVGTYVRPVWGPAGYFAVLDENLYYTVAGSNGTATVVSATNTHTWAATPNANMYYYSKTYSDLQFQSWLYTLVYDDPKPRP